MIECIVDGIAGLGCPMALGEWLLQSSGLNQRQTDLETENLEA
jgi:hypothetical protein